MFFLNFGLPNPNLSSFLGSIQWKIVKQLKMVISINFPIMKLSIPTFLNIITEMLAGIYLACAIKCFPSTWI